MISDKKIFKVLLFFFFFFFFFLFFVFLFLFFCFVLFFARVLLRSKKGMKKFQGVPESQTAAVPRQQEEEETDKYKSK